MEKLIDKISSYNILNNLIPGGIFIWLCSVLNIFTYSTTNIFKELVVYYFCGMTVSRVGSLVIETISLKVKAISYRKKTYYVQAEAHDSKLQELLAISNLYRTTSGMLFTIMIMKLCLILFSCFQISLELIYWMLIISLFVIYILSFYKQNKHIVSRVDIANKDCEK